MISAVEALRLPSAMLTDEERTAADRIEAELEIHVRKYMEFRGVDFKTTETRNNVIAELNQRLKAAGWSTQWQRMSRPNRLSGGAQECVGHMLFIAPTDESYGVGELLSSPSFHRVRRGLAGTDDA